MACQLEVQIPGLRRYAWALLRDNEAADDLVQDTLERAIAHWHLRRRDADLRAWLFTIERNLFLNHLRQRKQRGPHLSAEVLADMPAPDSAQDNALGARDVLAHLDRLSEDHRSILLLIGVEGLSYEAAARVLGVPVGTVMSRLSRARGRMRDFMENGRASVLRRVK
jgi:RNA polymerase sigma factor (sigma-70 family)